MHFNKKIFFRWIFYGFAQSFLVTIFALRSIALHSPTFTGKYGGYTETGDFIFCCMVVIANVKVLVSANIINLGIVATVIASIAFFITF